MLKVLGSCDGTRYTTCDGKQAPGTLPITLIQTFIDTSQYCFMMLLHFKFE